MLRLYILRHVKTAWALPGQRDIDRQLNAKGMADLDTIKGWIGKYDLSPGQVFCSTAIRTKATFEGIRDAFSPPPDVDYVDSFYSGYVDEYLENIQHHENPQNILIVGHNPSCASLASLLVSPNDTNGMRRVTRSFPAGALAEIEFDISDWKEIRPDSGTLRNFLVPRASQRYEA